MESKSLPKNEYKIYVNDQDINKLYTVRLYDSVQSGNKITKKKYDEIYDIRIEEFKNEHGELLAWMWYGISSFIKRIPWKFNPMAGIRLRQSNIQIGDGNTLVPLFKEDRGNYYFIGEVHAVHQDLVPNARRDYFNENKTRNQLEARLKLYFDENLKRLYKDANDAKNSYKRNIELLEKQKNYEKKKGIFVNDKEKEKMEQDIEEARLKDIKAQKCIDKLEKKSENNSVLEIVLEHVKKNYEGELKEKGLHKKNSIKGSSENKESKESKESKEDKENKENKPKKRKRIYLTDQLSNLNSKERKLVSKIYGVINQNLPSEEGNALINKIQEELKR
jgi:molecular chaperone HtpG